MTTIASCPECKQSLRVPDDMIGEQVQCPGCQHIFLARAEPVTSKAAPPAPPKPPAPPPVPAANPSEHVAEWDKSRNSSAAEEEFASPLAEDEAPGEEKKPRKRKEKEKRSKGGSSGGGIFDQVMHRGPLILTLGILGLILCAICGVFAWIMGTNDLNEMLSGRMDPKGRSMTNTGRILGMVSVSIWGIVTALFCAVCLVWPMIAGSLSLK
jgi:hypothetical protein